MTEQDYYSLLGVSKKASKAEIKKAYRKMVIKYHPDKHKNDTKIEKKFKGINEAYEVLKDDQKRAAYDHHGHQTFKNAGFNNAGERGTHGPQPGARGFNFSSGGMGDIFEEMFGSAFGGDHAHGGSSTKFRGADISTKMSISLEEAFHGANKKIKTQLHSSCDKCQGQGGKGSSICSKCQGHGAIRTQRGLFVMEQTCDTCRGEGRTIKEPCVVCLGQGRINKTQEVDVSIPEGIDSGMNIRLKGKGEAGVRGGANGDLYVEILVNKHKRFHREGHNLFCDVPISFAQAALGADIEVPLLEGTHISVKVPAGFQSGNKLKIKGKGLPILNSHGAGDLYIVANIETPVKLSARQKELLEEFEVIGSKNNPKTSSFFKFH